MDSADHPEILETFLGVRPRLMRVIYRRVHCSATTADLLQDTFLRFWEKEIDGKLHSVKVASAEFIMPAKLTICDGMFNIH